MGDAVFHEVRPIGRLAPGAHVEQRLLQGDGAPWHFHVALEWANADGTRGEWESELTLHE